MGLWARLCVTAIVSMGLGAALWAVLDAAGVDAGIAAVAAAGLPVVVVTLGAVWADRARETAAAEDTRLEQASARLAAEVKFQWTQEAGLRQILQPMPLQVRWSSTGRPVSASRDVVLDDEVEADWQELPMEGDADEIVDAFRSLPHSQLVILGEAGAGKSVLAMLLTLGILENLAPGERVPLLLPIASWNPTAEQPREFIVRRLREEYMFLTGPRPRGQDLAELLVTRGRILPILDGLDELPVAWHSLAIESLDRFAASSALVVTCRATDYEQAVARTGSLLSRAAVLEMKPVGVKRVIAFLSHPAPGRDRWRAVFKHLRKHPDDALAQALSRPLMTALARITYQARDTNPAELLEKTDFSGITGSLIGSFVSSVYRSDSSPGGQPWRPYAPDRAVHWLGSLAYQLYRAGTRDLWWWELRADVLWRRPGSARSSAYFVRPHLFSQWVLGPLRSLRSEEPAILGGFLAGCLVIGSAFGSALAAGSRLAVVASITVALIITVSAAELFRMLWPAGYPPYITQRRKPLPERLVGIPNIRLMKITLGVTVGVFYATAIHVLPGPPPSRIVLLSYALVGGIIGGLPPVRSAPIAFGVLFGVMVGELINSALLGLLGGVACGMIATIAPNLSLPVRMRRSGPRMTTHTNYRNAAAAAIQYALTGGIVFGVGANFVSRGPGVLFSAVIAGLVYAFAAAYCAGLWPLTRFRLTHALLASRGWLPWHLWTFLEDAHRRGVLRQAGTVWQFRHALLQNYLARRILLEQTRKRAMTGDKDAALHLAKMLAEQGRLDEAIAILVPHVQVGDRATQYELAKLLAHEGQVDQLRHRAEGGDRMAAERLVDVLCGQGRVGDALVFMRSRETIGEQDWNWRIADLLAKDGRVGELRERAEANEVAAQRLAELLAELYRVDEAIQVLRPHAAAEEHAFSPDGIVFVMDNRWHLAKLLADAGRINELMTCAEAGDRAALEHVTDFWAGQGRIDKAIETLEAHIGTDSYAAWRQQAEVKFTGGLVIGFDPQQRLAELLVEAGRGEQLMARAYAKDKQAEKRMIQVFADQGNVDDAIEIMQILLFRDRGFPDTHARLVEMLTKAGRVDQLRARADAGDHLAACSLGKLLAEQGLVDDAITLLREHSRTILQDHAQGLSTDVLQAAQELAELLARQGRIDELQERTDAGDVAAAERLADLLAERGRVNEAVTILGRLAEGDDARAAYRLDKLLVDHGRVNELQLRAEQGDRHATKMLLELLYTQGRVDELRVRAELGDGEAARRLADLLVGLGCVDEAIAILQIRANLGDWYAATRLPELLDRQIDTSGPDPTS